MADAFNNGHIVRNKQKCQTKLFLQIHQQIDDLRADRHIQRRNRFIGNHHFWIKGQRTRNANSLPLAAGKLMRIALRVFRQQSDFFQQPRHTGFGFCAFCQIVNQQRFHNGISYRQARIERGVGILKNKLDITAQMLQFTAADISQRLAVKGDGAPLTLHQF
ncbi:hypothetical protein SRABI106_04500 [Rahnella aquatilis]|nr:hypothetical protein SRABI106_04500 [Rahnella aquatilis]